VNPISEGVKRGVGSVILGHISEAVHNRASEIFQRTIRDLELSKDQSDFPKFAEELGFALRVSEIEESQKNIALCMFSIARLLRAYRWEDIDVTKTEAADLFFEASEIDRSNGNVRDRSICLTNSALSIIEKHRPTLTELEAARQRLETGMSLRTPYSEDWAFSKFNLGLYWSTIGATGVVLVRNLARAKNYMNGSLIIFAEKAEQHRSLVLGELARIEERLLAAKVEIALVDAVATNIHVLPERAQQVAANNPIAFGFILESNPQTMGLAETPPWITAAINSQPDDQCTKSIRTVLQKIQLLPESSENTGAEVSDSAQWYRARLEWILDPSAERFVAMAKSLGDLSENSDHELYFVRGMNLVSAARTTPSAQISVRLLLSLSVAYKTICSTRVVFRVQAFLRNHPGEIRFVACELCEHGEFEAAFDLLESTRSILQLPSNEFVLEEFLASEGRFSGVVWVYLTHSPKASYVIARSLDGAEPRTAGEVVDCMPGARLVQLTSSRAADQEGILISQDRSLPVSTLVRSTSTAIEALTPIADAINRLRLNLGGTSLVLMPSGLYAVLPVQAVDTSDRDLNYQSAPKMVATTMRATLHADDRIISSAHVLSAPVSTGLPELRHSDSEAKIVAGMLESMFSSDAIKVAFSASVADLLGAIGSADIVHVSSHSGADQLDPTQSSIAFSDGVVTVEDILTSGSSSCALVTLSSCQSGLAGPLVLADEFLSLQSALLYAGCRLSVGTLWPIIDIVGLLFFTRFYSMLFSAGYASLDFNAAWKALDGTRRWMKDSPVSEVIEFCDSHGVIWPLVWSQVSKETRILSQPSVWAAFYLSGSDARVNSLHSR
jgi:hypothetical protein